MISFHFDCYPLNRIFIRIQVCKRSIFLGSPNLASVVALYVYFKMTSDVFAAYFVRSRSSAEYFLRLLIQYISAPLSFFLKTPKVRRLCIKALFCFLLEVVFICWLVFQWFKKLLLCSYSQRALRSYDDVFKILKQNKCSFVLLYFNVLTFDF